MRSAAFVPLAALLLLIATVTGGAAQEPVVIRGIVVDREDGAGLGGINVQLDDGPPVLTAADGGFAFDAVPPGRYALSVRGLGYAPEVVALVVRADTTVVIALDRSPVPLDTLEVRGRTIRIQGTVRDSATGLRLIDVDVLAGPDRTVITDPIGRFSLDGMAAGVPHSIEARELGYLPYRLTLEAAEDTTVDLLLVTDPLAAAMIERAKQRLAERSSERAYSPVAVIGRAQLIQHVNRFVDEVLADVLRTRTGRIACVIVDERLLPLGRIMLETMLPDRIEHIEFLEFGFIRGQLMVRIYTRDFFVDIMGGNADLEPGPDLIRAARRGDCR